MNDMQKHLLKIKLSEYFVNGTVFAIVSMFVLGIIFG